MLQNNISRIKHREPSILFLQINLHVRTCGKLSMMAHRALSPIEWAAVADSFSSMSTVRSTRLPLPIVLHGKGKGEGGRPNQVRENEGGQLSNNYNERRWNIRYGSHRAHDRCNKRNEVKGQVRAEERRRQRDWDDVRTSICDACVLHRYNVLYCVEIFMLAFDFTFTIT